MAGGNVTGCTSEVMAMYCEPYHGDWNCYQKFESGVDDRLAFTAHPHVIIPVGIFFFVVMFLSLLFNKIKQTPIIACIVVGMTGAAFFKKEIEVHLPKVLVHTLVEIGLILVLFMGGLEVDLATLKKSWKKTLLFGGGQILTTICVCTALGYGVFLQGDQVAAVPAIFFGISMTLSSTILVMGTLKKRHDMAEPHGQIVVGMMVLQDITAVVSLAVMASLDPCSGKDIGFEIGMIFVKLIVLLLVLFGLSKSGALDKAFEWFAVSDDLLFLAVFGYCFGISSFCALAHFSAEMGAFFAGVSLSAMPYKLEIEKKAEPLKHFGVALFFIMLGFNLDFTPSDFFDVAPFAMLAVLIICFLSPFLMILIGRCGGVLSRQGFLVGGIINQISEFSLVIAQVAKRVEIFDERTYLMVTVSCVFSLFFSGLIHQFLDVLWEKCFRKIFQKCDPKKGLSRAATSVDQHNSTIYILEYTEITQAIIDHFAANYVNENIIVVTLNSQIHKFFGSQKMLMPDGTFQTKSLRFTTKVTPDVADPEKGKMESGKTDSSLPSLQESNKTKLPPLQMEKPESPKSRKLDEVTCVYADPTDPTVWHHLHFGRAKMIISCMDGGMTAELLLARTYLDVATVVCVTNDYSEATQLYDAGCDFVIQTDQLAAQGFTQILCDDKEGDFKKHKEAHMAQIEEIKGRLGKLFYHS